MTLATSTQIPTSVANLLVFTAHGMRLARRSLRTWVFIVLAVGSGFALYHFFAPIHVFGQSSAPRFSVPGFGALTLYVLLLGVVYLTFDLHHRDRQERVADALNVRPFANIEFLAGHLFAVTATAWLGLVALALLLHAFGVAVEGLNHRLLGEPPEPLAMAIFVLLDAPPALLFWGAFVMLLNSVLRIRWLVALLATSLQVLHFVLLFHTPLFLLPALAGISNLGLPGSDIYPRAPGLGDYAQRTAVLVLASGWLLFASARMAREDVRTAKQALRGTVLIAVGCASLAGLVGLAYAQRIERQTWANVHAAEADAPRPDLESLAGHVRIDPGREVDIVVDLHVAATRPLDVLTFSLNPGMDIREVRLDGEDAPHTHRLGVLAVVPPRPLAPGSRAVVRVEASGIPDHRFAYLDSAVDALGQSLMDSPLALLGEQSSLFLADYVALMPGTRWLPFPGSNWATDDPVRRPADFHDLDLVVSVPPGWTPVGAGRTGATAPWRFRTSVPVSDHALIVAPFERRALRVAGVECELLMHPEHMHQVDLLSDALSEKTIVHFLNERFSAPGLRYPHGSFSIVEAPAQLRRYGSGWRMKTLQGLAGIQLLPEHGFPTARFEARYPSEEAAPGAAQAEVLARIDRSGPNAVPLSAGYARNLLPFLTAAEGEGAFALNYLLEALTARHVMGSHRIAPGAWLRPSVPSNSGLAKAILRAMGTATVQTAWFEHHPEPLESRSEGVSLIDVDPRQSLAAADILIHKGDQIAAMIEGVLGRPKVREFLSLVRHRYTGTTFTAEYFMDALGEVEPSLPLLVRHLLNESTLAGFLASPLRVVRIRDDEKGHPRHQIALHVRNDEPAPGVVALAWRTESDGVSLWHFGAHVIVPGRESIEIGAISEDVPREVRLETYLSLNRRALQLPLPDFDPAGPVDSQPFHGVRPSSWTPRQLGIVVDDLDPGFSVTAPDKTSLRWGRRPREVTTAAADIPEFGRFHDDRWRRQSSDGIAAWGKYRRTLVRKPAAEGRAHAHFETVLPTTGRWQLAYHLPGELRYVRYGRLVRPEAVRDIEIGLVHNGRKTPLSLDARHAVAGWNDIGVFPLPAGQVRVVISDKTSGDVVVADAIRWQRLD